MGPYFLFHNETRHVKEKSIIKHWRTVCWWIIHN